MIKMIMKKRKEKKRKYKEMKLFCSYGRKGYAREVGNWETPTCPLGDWRASSSAMVVSASDGNPFSW